MSGRPRPLSLDAAQRAKLARWSRSRRVPFRLVIRSRIVLLSADGRSARSIARELKVSPATVACWRSRFELLGIDGISRDAPRFNSRRALPRGLRTLILRRSVEERPAGRRFWSSRALAESVGVSHTTVLRIWRAQRDRRYRTPIAAIAHDPRFQPRALDLSGVFLDVPRAAVVLTDRMRLPRAVGSRRTPSDAPASPLAPGTSAPAATEFVRLVERLEHVPAGRSGGHASRLEFLAFLGSASERPTRGTRTHILLSDPDDATRAALARWSSAAPEARIVESVGSIPLHEFVERWLADRRRVSRSRLEPADLPPFRRAVDRWASEPDPGSRPFAWLLRRGS